MRVTVPHQLADRMKQLTWLAGRKSTPMPWQRTLQISRYGVAATDDFCAGWVPSGGAFPMIADGFVYAPEAQSFRKQITGARPTEQGLLLDIGEPDQDHRLLQWCVSTGAAVRKAGYPWPVNIKATERELQRASKRGQVRWESRMKLHVPTAKRVLRQVKAKDNVMFHYTDHMVYLQCPVTGVEFLMSKIHPSIDPDKEEA